MSNKSKARKKRHKSMLDFLLTITKVAVASKVASQKMREIKYPKLATGGTVYGSLNELIKGGEMVVPFVSKKIYLDDNCQYMFQDD